MTRFIAFVSGKGGVGKTTTALNVAQALHKLGKQVILVDGNIATPNIGLQLGLLRPEGTLNRFLRKEKGLHDIIYRHESGVSIIPSSLSLVEFQKTNPQLMTRIFEHLDNMAEFVLVDAPSGLGPEVNEILKNTDEVLIVANPNLSSIMDALKTIQLARVHDNHISGVILNLSNYGWSELKPEDVGKILCYPIIANVRHDRKFRKSLLRLAPLSYLYPRSRSAKEFGKVAQHLCAEENAAENGSLQKIRT